MYGKCPSESSYCLVLLYSWPSQTPSFNTATYILGRMRFFDPCKQKLWIVVVEVDAGVVAGILRIDAFFAAVGFMWSCYFILIGYERDMCARGECKCVYVSGQLLAILYASLDYTSTQCILLFPGSKTLTFLPLLSIFCSLKLYCGSQMLFSLHMHVLWRENLKRKYGRFFSGTKVIKMLKFCNCWYLKQYIHRVKSLYLLLNCTV